MNWQSAFNIAFAAAGFLGGYTLNNIHETNVRLAEKLNTVEVMVVKEYVPRAELKDQLEGIAKKLEKIDEKLDKARVWR